MARFIPKTSTKAGMKPGSVVYVGKQRQEPVNIDIIEYDQTDLHRHHNVTIGQAAQCRASALNSWINVDGIHNVDIINRLGEAFGISPLDLEDIANTGQRPRVDHGDSYVFISAKMLLPKHIDDHHWIEQVTLVFGKGWLISFQEPGDDVFDAVRQRLIRTEPRARFMTTDYLAYALLDAVVDNYFIILERFGDEIETLEDKLESHPDPDCLGDIRALKRRLILMRKAVWPLREAIAGLERTDSELITPHIEPYLHDLRGHVLQAIDTIETFRDMVSGLLDLYHTEVSNHLNEIMKTLTVFAAIFIPLGFLAGVFGMNFDTGSPFNMPELGFRYGYLMFWAIALTVGGGLLVFFRRKHWL